MHAQEWVTAFFREAGLESVERQAALVGPPTYSVLSRCNSTISLTYTFDSSIRFRAAPGTVTAD